MKTVISWLLHFKVHGTRIPSLLTPAWATRTKSLFTYVLFPEWRALATHNYDLNYKNTSTL